MLPVNTVGAAVGGGSIALLANDASELVRLCPPSEAGLGGTESSGVEPLDFISDSKLDILAEGFNAKGIN